MRKVKIEVDTDYVAGHLRHGHFEMTMTEEEYEEFLLIDDEDEQKGYIEEMGMFFVDDFEMDDYGELQDISVYRKKEKKKYTITVNQGEYAVGLFDTREQAKKELVNMMMEYEYISRVVEEGNITDWDDIIEIDVDGDWQIIDIMV